MKKLATSLLAWLLLLTLPFQAVAAVAMLPCTMQAPAHHQAAGEQVHHASVQHQHLAVAEPVHHASGDHQHPGKVHAGCSSCTACCPVAFMAAAALRVAALPSGAAEPAMFVDRHHGSIDLALPERPPSTRLA